VEEPGAVDGSATGETTCDVESCPGMGSFAGAASLAGAVVGGSTGLAGLVPAASAGGKSVHSGAAGRS